MSTVETKLLKGKVLAEAIQEKIVQTISELKAAGKQIPTLRQIQVGNDPSAESYLGQQRKLAEKLGIGCECIGPEQTKDQAALLDQIKQANEDDNVHGVFITMPLPEGYDADEALLALDPHKDVEGVHPTSLGLIVLRKSNLIPPTAHAAFRLIESTGVSLRGKKATIVGQSAIVGRPLQLLLGENRVTTTVCNTGTSTEDLRAAIAASDIVVACAGNPGFIQGDWIQPGQIVIDVATTEVDGKLVGDVQFDSAAEKAAFITPVPGGVGPLTVTLLMENLMRAYTK